MEKGCIYRLLAEYKYLYNPESYRHPFIFWEQENSDIRGIMLTASNLQNYGNKEFQDQHFEEGYEIKNGKSDVRPISHYAPLYLLKEIRDEHLGLVGKLSNEGMTFIELQIKNLEYTDWESHIAKLKV